MEIDCSLPSYFEKAIVRNDLIELIPESSLNVLEVGCGAGKSGQAIRGRGINVIGLDVSSQAIEAAKEKECYEKLVVCDLDKSPIPPEIQAEEFDAILYPDVLEHLLNPLGLITAHLSLLKPDGVMIASIPNIRHGSVLRDLVLRGRWTYQEMGILDETHLRFFTKKEMIRLFEQAGLNVTLINPRNLKGPKLLKLLNSLTFQAAEEFLTVQYLIRANKK